MPLLLGFVLVALFIWFAENIGTFANAWRYPNQSGGWCPSPLGSWFLLMIISYVMVSVVNRPEDISAAPVAEMPREGGESGGSGASLISGAGLACVWQANRR